MKDKVLTIYQSILVNLSQPFDIHLKKITIMVIDIISIYNWELVLAKSSH